MTYTPLVPDKQEMQILMGLPASGKSTKAIEWVKKDPAKRLRINYDDMALENPGMKFDDIRIQARTMVVNALKLGMSVVIDNTNLNLGTRQGWIDLAKANKVPPIVVPVGQYTPIWDLIARDKKRGLNSRVGRAVIERMALFNGLLNWTDTRTYNYEGFVICDLDGTLCDTSHRQHFVDVGFECKGCNVKAKAVDWCGKCGKTLTPIKKNWAAFFAGVGDDKLNAPVAEMLDMFINDGYGILLVSGRPTQPCAIPTEDWLSRHGIKYDHLFMRDRFDNRSDVIVKQEILDRLPKDQIDYVLDDRDSVVKMWRNNGLFCLQVAEGDF